MTQFQKIITIFTKNQIDFIVIGGVALAAQGSAYITLDIDLCYKRSNENLKKIVNALKSYGPKLRGAPKDLPFIFDEKTLKAGMNFTFSSTLGDIDLLGEVSGLGFYEDTIKYTEKMNLYGFQCDVLTIEGLLKSKKAANRLKDKNHIAELEELLKLKKEK